MYSCEHICIIQQHFLKPSFLNTDDVFICTQAHAHIIQIKTDLLTYPPHTHTHTLGNTHECTLSPCASSHKYLHRTHYECMHTSIYKDSVDYVCTHTLLHLSHSLHIHISPLSLSVCSFENKHAFSHDTKAHTHPAAISLTM
ncbi:hypothetical protein ATANTOWER_004973 [Ataeniobius toweri]|uniref:Uncharacterized protein n=1 Tax=Ataeniobius toweri TaxID=208326 RepID=A0ABU7AKM5_9TELE|nr:hypothetical protein [Ataeniobius toweri]